MINKLKKKKSVINVSATYSSKLRDCVSMHELIKYKKIDPFYGKLEQDSGVNYKQKSWCTQMISRCRVGRFGAVKGAAWYCVRRASNEQILGFVAYNKNSTELHPRVSWQFFRTQTSFRRKSRDWGCFTPNSLVDSELEVFRRLLLFCTLSNKSNL